MAGKESQPVTLPKDGLMITRRRKKWKFAHFNNWPNCFSLDRDKPLETRRSLKAFFAKDQPLVLELAAGNTQFSLELARRYPKLNFIAIDIKSDRLYSSAKQAQEEGIGNIAFLRMHMDNLEHVFTKDSVQTIWLTFPDPYLRKRSIKRRLSHLSFLQQYRKILRDTGKLLFKTDNRELFLWSLEQLVADNWHILELSFDLHESDLPDDYKIKTAYENRFLALDIPINFVKLSA